MGFVHIVATIEPENVKAILSTKFNDFDLGTRREKAFQPLLGYGIFCTDGARWEHSRALLRPSFARSRVADFGLLERHVEKLLRLIPRDESVVDLQKMFFDFTMDTASEFLMGTSVDRLGNPDDKESQAFVDAFNYAQRCLVDRTRYGAFLPFYRNKQFDASVRICHQWIDKFIHQNLECRAQAGHGKQSESYNILEELSWRSRISEDLRDQLLCVLLAGRDTTAGLISNVFYFLARHKDVLQRLQSEVAALQGRPPSFVEVKQMKYLASVIDECRPPIIPTRAFQRANCKQRHDSPVGGGPEGKSPVLIRKGQIVMYNVYSMHRRKDIYGPDADQFRPERWDKLRPGWAFLPFNGGPHICVGQQYALSEVSYTTVRILQNFNGIEAADHRGWAEDLTISCCNFYGLQVRMKPAAEI
ncbi:cytochrome P450 [Aspergillus desertorum]